MKNFSILDSDTIIHIFNKITCFLNYWSAPYRDFVWAGKSKIAIQEYGDVDIQILSPKSKLQILHLYDITYCEDFATNLVFFRQLQKLGFWWNTRVKYNYLYCYNNLIVVYLHKVHDQSILKYIFNDYLQTRIVFYIRRNKFNTWTERYLNIADVMQWHL